MGWNSGMEFIEWASKMAWSDNTEEQQIELMVKIINKTIAEDCDIHAEFLGQFRLYDEAYRRVFGEDDAYKQWATVLHSVKK